MPSNCGSSVGRGRRMATKATTWPVHNWAREFALQHSASAGVEAPNARNSLLSTMPDAMTDEIGGNVIIRSKSHQESIRVYQRRCFPRNFSITTLNNRFSRYPLRTGTDPTFLFNSITNQELPQALQIPGIYMSKVGLPRPSKAVLRSLYNGPLPSTSPIQSTTSTAPILLILAVGVAYGGLKDPHHDLKALEILFKSCESERTYFRSISGERATLETIEEALGELYQEALKSLDSSILILLTGDGDEDNRMRLMGNVFITDQDLRCWMWKLQINSHPNNRTVTIILDHCRPNKDVPFGTRPLPLLPTQTSHLPPFGIQIIWSCSPGQMATALLLPSTQDIPRSCFLLAIMMASYSARIKGVIDIIPTINHELGRLLRLLQLTHKKIHETSRCNHCSGNQPCLVPIQEPYWKWAGSMESIYHLVHALSNMEIVSKVYEAFTSNTFFCEANGLQPKRVDSGPSSYIPHQGATVQCTQGPSKIAHPRLVIQTEPLQSERMAPHPPCGTSTQHLQGPQIPPANSWKITQGTLTESPVDTHPYCCTHIPNYSFKWCTCFIHDL